ncbi:MAG: hypothetical protein QNJ00_14655 [Woeseiaceae bacterium]|nr:hypothetical protein [Woeseiaceae bacterium]
MRILKILLALFVVAAPAAALGAVSAGDLPDESTWYFHVDFAEMRGSEAGRSIYNWLETEVFEEILDETGVDLGKEADQVTAFSDGNDGFIMVLEGRISDKTRDKALAVAATAERFETFEHRGRTFYRVVGDGDDIDVDDGNIEIDGFDDEAFFSFAIKNKLLVASSRAQMEELLGNKGRIAGGKSHDGALFVLTAEKSLIQAGLDTGGFDTDEDDGFQSNIMRNTKQVALMIADVAGNVAIEAQLVAEEAEKAEALGSIVRGLIALQAFSDDMDPDVAQFLRNLKVDVQDRLLKVSVAISPALVTATLEDA